MVQLGVPNPGIPNKRKRPNNGLAFTNVAKSEYRTSCKVCRLGIFTSDDAVWGRGQLLGLMHADCARQAGATVVDQQPAPAPASRPAVSAAERRVYGGVLTDRQIAVVQLLADGHTPPQIAQIEQVTYQTVNNTIARARLRIGVDDNAALIEAARRHGLIRERGE